MLRQQTHPFRRELLQLDHPLSRSRTRRVFRLKTLLPDDMV